MPNTTFTSRLRGAVEKLHADSSLRIIECRSGSLYSPLFASGTYTWAKVMDSDGLLVAPRVVRDGERGAPDKVVELLVGVVLQSEDATSQTKPNPLGKAALGHIPNGIWVDIKSEGRRRLDRVLVVFVLPKGAAPSRKAKFAAAKRNAENAATLMPDVATVEVPRGESATKIAELLRKTARPFLKGRGRPPAS